MKTKIIFFILFSIYFLNADQTSDRIFSKYIFDLSLEGGAGIYVGNFAEHLYKDKAYIATPILDLYASFYIIKYLGLQFLIGSGCIIHPYSEPIEGTIIYMGLELFNQFDWKYGFAKIFAGAGFEHTTMLLQWYSSGFLECGTTAGFKITEWMYFITSIKYRMGFLHSIIIKDKYNLSDNDTLMSISATIGLSFKVKNPYIK